MACCLYMKQQVPALARDAGLHSRQNLKCAACFLVMSLLQTPSLFYKSFLHTFLIGIWLCFQPSRGAHSNWSTLLCGSGSCIERQRGKPVQCSTFYGLTRKDGIFLLHLNFLHTCRDSPQQFSGLLKEKFLGLESQHISLDPPSLHCSYTSLV